MFNRVDFSLILLLIQLISSLKGQAIKNYSTLISLKETTTCILPNGKQSICVQKELCGTFKRLVEQFGYTKPPQCFFDDIKEHKLRCTNGNICCPDHAVTTTTTTTTTLAPPLKIMKIADYDYEALKNHPNLYLVNSEKCGQATANKIYKGFDANLKEIPWQALLGYQTLEEVVWNCGGALISTRYVATASHCNGTRAITTVRLGEHNLLTERDCQGSVCADPVQDIAVEKFIKHPDFDVIEKRNDIALIRLAADADTSQNNINTICLPIDASNDVEKVLNTLIRFTISGFGQLENGRTSDILQMAFLPYVSNAECVKKYKSLTSVTIHKDYLCAGGQNKTDTCKGDSGGPIYAFALSPKNKAKIRANLYGTVIGGIICSKSDLVFPGIYSDIRYYLKWILDTIKP